MRRGFWDAYLTAIVWVLPSALFLLFLYNVKFGWI